jgi:hypothetical protein
MKVDVFSWAGPQQACSHKRASCACADMLQHMQLIAASSLAGRHMQVELTQAASQLDSS